jgi:hypothetical protein
MAIFLMSIVAIGHLITLAGENSIEIEQRGEAAMLAQSKMAEVIWGAVPLSAQSDQEFDEAPDYKWALTADQNGNIANLWNVTVTVTRERSDGSKVESVLSQMVLDPAQRGSSQDTVSISGSSGGGGQGGGQSSSPQTPSAQSPQGQTPATATPATARPSTTTPGAGTAPRTTTPGATTTPSTTTPRTTPSTTTPRTTTPSTSKGGR